ncbi:serine/threonine protein kinase [Candidatus Similichlamydia laticola]|uniref:Type III secretion S/T Protein Kinase n=1 Tax=Candidatus Similichlamydia laticola TaxID=2170265 RepID=A0A369KFZ2_9BACT|nr:protein kinase [Candidatus Similichlamydia laticola]RDB31827.1 Type III secretion S/T Protein Kinase [Candidatus Similichlamydia laticola]
METYRGYSLLLEQWLCIRLPKTSQGTRLIQQQIPLLQLLEPVQYVERIVPEMVSQTHTYLATYWIEGYPSTHLMRQSNVSLEERLQWVFTFAEIIQALHEVNIVHGDLQPENILISKEHPVLIDFELAFQLNQSPCYTFGGTGSYMSPEVRLGRVCDKKSEQYALALLSYEWLVQGFCFGHPDLSRLPFRLRLPFQRALQADPCHRFPSVALFARALRSAWEEATLVKSDFFQKS